MIFFKPTLMALGHPVPTLLPEGEGLKSPLPLRERARVRGSGVSLPNRIK
jgi:hypothetical protein